MKSSLNLISEIDQELTRSRGRYSPPSKDSKLKDSPSKLSPRQVSKKLTPLGSPSKLESKEALKSEILAQELLEKLRQERGRFSEECQRLRVEINRLLNEDRGWIYVED
jgi:hypothetical protein